MVAIRGSPLSPAQQKQLIALQRTARDTAISQKRLATGLRVSSATDDPQNFFTSRALKNRSADLSRLLDGLNQGIRTIETAEAGLQALSRLVEQARSSISDLRRVVVSDNQSYSDLILEDDPVLYYRLNGTSSTAENLGSGGAVLNGNYVGGVSRDQGSITLAEGVSSAGFDGVNGRVNVPSNALLNTDNAGYPERTIELTFRANNTDGRQVLYEEGGTGNAIAIYIDDGRVYVSARDAGDFGPFNINAEIESGETYHVALTLDAPGRLFTGYLNGENIGTGVVTKPLNRHGAGIGIGRNAGGSYFHDGPEGGNGEYFNGQIADVAVYNDVLSQDRIQSRYDATLLAQAEATKQTLLATFEQINPLIDDASYRGINLLDNNSLTTYFNEDLTSSLTIEGLDFKAVGLGDVDINLQTLNALDNTFNAIERGRDKIRSFGNSLSNDFAILGTREIFLQETINTLEAGGDDLTVLDQNEEGANMLALQTRQQLQSTVLALTAQTPVADILT